MIIPVANIYWALTVYKPGRLVHEFMLVCKHPVNSSYFHSECTQGHTAARDGIRIQISSQAKGLWSGISPLSASAQSGLCMTLIVFVCMKQNVCLPKEMLLCFVIWREELWVLWNSVTHSRWLCVTKDINLQDRLGQEGQLGLGTGPCCLQLIGSAGLTSQHLLTWHSSDVGRGQTLSF